MSVPSKQTLRRHGDLDALRSKIRRLAVGLKPHVIFAGEVNEDGSTVLTEFSGTRTRFLRGLAVQHGKGLGGRVVETRSALVVDAYHSNRGITHDYDHPVRAEGLLSVAAAPVVVDNRVRAVLYVASRNVGRISDRSIAALTHTCDRLAMEIEVRDEVDRRIEMLRWFTPPDTAPSYEEIRAVYSEMRKLARETSDQQMSGKLLGLSSRLALPAAGNRSSCIPSLSPREIDVLSFVALGYANSEIARKLAISDETVKSYLRAAMQKLDVNKRHRAVIAARQHGFLP